MRLFLESVQATVRSYTESSYEGHHDLASIYEIGGRNEPYKNKADNRRSSTS